MNKLPLTRTKDLVVQELGNEVLIYDLTTDKIFCLNETSALVYQACDGKTSFDELRKKTKLTDELILLAIDEFDKQNLLAEKIETGISRRKILASAAVLAAALPLPKIMASVAPSPSAAASRNCVPAGQSARSSVDTTQEPYQNCYDHAAAQCCSGTYSGGSGGTRKDSKTFTCALTCS